MTELSGASDGQQYLNEKTVVSMLGLALGPDFSHPLCKELPATHAAGTAVVRFAELALANDTGFVRDVADVCYGEVDREKIFDVEKLAEHASLAHVLSSLLRRLAASWSWVSITTLAADLERSMALGPPEPVGYNLSVACNELLSLMDILDNTVFPQMAELMRKKPQKDTGSSSNKKQGIKTLLQKQLAPLQLSIKRCLNGICLDLHGKAAQAAEDWEGDFEALSSCH